MIGGMSARKDPVEPESEVPEAGRRRRGRPPSIDTAGLLSVARELFLERGIRATTHDVAIRAGISEGVIFHRFGTKESLFRAAMELPAADVPRLLLEAFEKVDGLELREALLQLASALLEIGRVAIPLMMMSWSNPTLGGGTPQDEHHSNFRIFVRRLAAFFEARMATGALRALDAEIIARAFLGSIHHYCMTRILCGDTDSAVIPEGMFARGLVDLLLNGALATPDVTAPFAARRDDPPRQI